MRRQHVSAHRAQCPAIQRSLLAIALVLGGLANWVVAPAARAANPSSDIPGIPMPGPVVTGQLGGPIYDVVFQVYVPPGSVLVASLRGTAGTDFDLYLFDQTATTVVSNVGLVAKSTGPTSTESLSHGTATGGTFYIDLNGATNVEGTYTLAVQVVPDRTPPTVSVLLAGGRPTNQLSVPVALTVIDALASVTNMTFSADGTTWGSWVPFLTSTTFTLSAGDGTRDVWVKVRNSVGLESAPARASVVIDTVQPSALDIQPPPGSLVGGLRPRFTVRFDEPIDPSSWAQLGLVVQQSTGDLVPGTFTYDGSTLTGSFVPSADLVPGGVYIVTIGTVRDLAGNSVAPRGSWTVTPLIPASVSAYATPAVLVVGGTATLRAIIVTTVSVPALEVAGRTATGTSFVPFATMPLAAGRGALVLQPFANTTYRVTSPGSATVQAAQVDIRVLVRRSIALTGTGSSVVRTARVGRSTPVTATIGPRAAGLSITLTLYRWDAVRRTWTKVTSRIGNSSATGSVSTSWAPSSAGLFAWRAAVAPSPDYANNLSALYRFSVSR